MNILQTDLNERLAKSVSRRISAERFFNFGRGGFWYLVGIGLVFFGIGTSVGFGFYGYSQILRHTDDINVLSSILADSLSKVHFHSTAEGTVQLDPREVALAEGQTVSLANDSRVLLDRTSTVTANGEMKVTISSGFVPPVSTARALPKTPLVTNFTVFKRVPFAKGAIMTGWIFLTSAQTSPTNQYCYYTANLETPGFDISMDIGEDGELIAPKKLPTGFDLTAAFSRCVWFRTNQP